jgi:hypothetical protein
MNIPCSSRVCEFASGWVAHPVTQTSLQIGEPEHERAGLLLRLRNRRQQRCKRKYDGDAYASRS